MDADANANANANANADAGSSTIAIREFRSGELKMALISQTFLIFVQNLSERMSFLELLNCNGAEKSYRLIMA